MRFRPLPTIQKDTHQASQPWESSTIQKNELPNFGKPRKGQKQRFPTLGTLKNKTNRYSQPWESSKRRKNEFPNLGKPKNEI